MIITNRVIQVLLTVEEHKHGARTVTLSTPNEGKQIVSYVIDPKTDRPIALVNAKPQPKTRPDDAKAEAPAGDDASKPGPEEVPKPSAASSAGDRPPPEVDRCDCCECVRPRLIRDERHKGYKCDQCGALIVRDRDTAALPGQPCPECGKEMQAVKTEPEGTSSHWECDCGYGKPKG